MFEQADTYRIDLIIPCPFGGIATTTKLPEEDFLTSHVCPRRLLLAHRFDPSYTVCWRDIRASHTIPYALECVSRESEHCRHPGRAV